MPGQEDQAEAYKTLWTDTEPTQQIKGENNYHALLNMLRSYTVYVATETVHQIK